MTERKAIPSPPDVHCGEKPEAFQRVDNATEHLLSVSNRAARPKMNEETAVNKERRR